MNLLLAGLIITGVGVFYGADTEVPTVSSVSQCLLPADEDRACTDEDEPTAAKAAGFQVDDSIVAVDGAAVDDWDTLVSYIQGHAETEVVFTVIRDGEEIVLVASPTLTQRPVVGDDGEYVVDRDGEIVTESVGFLGVSPTLDVVKQGLWYGPAKTAEYVGLVGEVVVHLPEHLWHTGRAVLGLEERDPDGIMSIVGAGRISGEIAAIDDPEVGLADQIAAMFVLVAAVNLALFIFNLIPLTPLDGGHVAGAVWEGLKNGWARFWTNSKPPPVDLARMMPLTYVGVLLLVLMGALLIWADIVAPVKLG